jgi:hypothetical protein
MTSYRKRPRLENEAGLSLVEVIMYSTLTTLVLTVLAGLFYAGFQAQAVAGQRDTATGSAQVVSNSLQTSVRNASGLLVSSTVLQARVATGDSGWQCVAWALTADGNLAYKAASSAITSTDYSTWTVLASGVSGRRASGGAFSISPTAESYGVATQVSYSFGFASGNAVVPIAGTAAAGAYGTGGPETCW